MQSTGDFDTLTNLTPHPPDTIFKGVEINGYTGPFLSHDGQKSPFQVSYTMLPNLCFFFIFPFSSFRTGKHKQFLFNASSRRPPLVSVHGFILSVGMSTVFSLVVLDNVIELDLILSLTLLCIPFSHYFCSLLNILTLQLLQRCFFSSHIYRVCDEQIASYAKRKYGLAHRNAHGIIQLS